MTARATWKHWEWRLAQAVGGRRIPVTGLDRHGADVVDAMFAYQAKLRKSIPGWLFDWLGGICATAGERIGVLVLRTPGMPDAEALVVLRWADWVALHGKPASDE